MRSQAHPDRFGALLEGGRGEGVERHDGGRAGHRVAAIGAAQPAGVGGVHDLGATGDRRQRQPAGDGFATDDDVGRHAVVLDREQPPGAAHAGLHLVGDVEHAVFAAARAQVLGKARRQRQEAALALHRLHHHRGHRLGRHLGDQRVVELVDAVLDVIVLAHAGGAAIDVGEGQPVDLAGEGAEALLEQRVLAGHRHGQVGAPVVGAFEHDQRLPAGVGAGHLDRRFHRLRAAVEQRRLLGEVARRERVEALAHLHVGRVAGDDRAHVDQLAGLRADGVDHRRRGMAERQRADAAGEVDEGVAVHVGHRGAAAAGDGDRREPRRAARDRRVAACDERAALGAGDFGQKLD